MECPLAGCGECVVYNLKLDRQTFLAPAVVTAVGLAWKAEIAAEIIAYTKKSIGQGINDAKYSMDTATVFAWTVVIIIFSLCLEIITKKILRRIK